MILSSKSVTVMTTPSTHSFIKPYDNINLTILEYDKLEGIIKSIFVD